ncbi:hypothetical protein SDC9_121888 [bioreactor metagenome]|uniref:Uncharacterized protein n=1 Tax=bioreactor metagenome TaxID=1076179 RepID=A0A645CD72_9ZZZZ
MLLVKMGGNHHLKAVAPQLFGSFHTDLVRKLGRSLFVTEALVGMKRDCSADLSVPLFGHHHLLCCGFRNTVDTADKMLPIGFISIRGIFHDIKNTLHILVGVCRVCSF